VSLGKKTCINPATLATSSLHDRHSTNGDEESFPRPSIR